MQYSELRQFLKESNAEGLSPIEKDVFQYYHSRTQNDDGVWFCPDSEVADEIFRSRNGVCSARKSLLARGWITENSQFNICVVRKFTVPNQTDESEIRLKPKKHSPKSDSAVRNQTENAPFESEIRLDESEIRLTYKEEEKEEKEEKINKEVKRSAVAPKTQTFEKFPEPRGDVETALWSAFLESRAKMKKPLTAVGYERLVNQLARLPSFDINDRLIEAVDRKWQGLIFDRDLLLTERNNGKIQQHNNFKSAAEIRDERAINSFNAKQQLRAKVAERNAIPRSDVFDR